MASTVGFLRVFVEDFCAQTGTSEKIARSTITKFKNLNFDTLLNKYELIVIGLQLLSLKAH